MTKDHALLVLFDVLRRYEAGDLPLATVAHDGGPEVAAFLGSLSPEMTGVFVAFDREIDRLNAEHASGISIN